MNEPIEKTINDYEELMNQLVEHVDNHMTELLPFCLDKIAENVVIPQKDGIVNKHKDKRMRQLVSDAFAMWCMQHFQNVRQYYEQQHKNTPKA